MSDVDVVWLVSYPRSGNTFLRTILYQCFGLYSASIYPKDIGGNQDLGLYIGHIEHGPDHRIRFPEDAVPLVKTHEYDKDENPAIYVIRDGRAASVSMWKFYSKNIPLEAIIEGQHRFGTWADHLKSWNPWERPNTLLLEYESMRRDLLGTLKYISDFLKRDIKRDSIPERNAIAGVDGRWVKKYSNWRSEISDELLLKFNEINGDMLRIAGYLD